MSPSHLFREYVDTLIVERWKTAEQSVEYATKGPHVDALAISLVLDYLGSSVTNCSARRHRLLVPHDFTKAEIRYLDPADTASTETRNKLAFVLLFLFKLPGRRVLRGYDRYTLKEKVLRLDVTVDDTTLLVQVPDALRDLEYDVACQILAEVGKLDDLVEKLATLHHCGVRESAKRSARK